MESYDVIVVGAGAAGMMCASVAGQRGKRVLLIDHASKLAEKIRISGGGRCNFTNLYATSAQFFSEHPVFSRSALSAYTPQDFIQMMRRYRIAFHEKHKGQLFCDESSQQVIDLLAQECEAGRVQWRKPCKVHAIRRVEEEAKQRFILDVDGGSVRGHCLVIATGGLAIPQIGSTDWGLQVARQFGIKVIEPRPALVPLTFEPAEWASFSELAGLSLEIDIRCQVAKEKAQFREDILMTHRGLSGPAILQASTVWKHGEPLRLNLVPDYRLEEVLVELKQTSRQQLGNVLSQWLPRRLAMEWCHRFDPTLAEQSIHTLSDKVLRRVGASLNDWRIQPKGSEGYRKAEVMRGGVDTRALNQQSMEVKSISGLYFIGETVDMTGWLGGYNFQWAWSSGVAAGRAI
jgi:predicted Rossmann fold flavoprotein